jgi:O-antigen ligase
MLELAILSIYVSIIFRNHRFFISSLYTLIITAIMQSFIAFYQYYYQHSLFISPYLHNITGESILAPAAPGIAKIVINGEKIVRAYGTFPHPNILGGFLLFSFLLSIYIYARHKSRLMSNFSYPLFFYLYRLLWTLVFFLQLLALYLSFSRSAWLGFLISLFFVLLLILKNRIVSRETILPIKLFLMQYRAFAFAICTFLLLFINSVSLFNYRIFQDTAYPQDAPSHAILQNKTFSDRLFYNNVSRETITHQPLIGSGPGTAIFQINRYLINTFKNTAIESWGYQPTHNIYLLAASEVGLLGCIIFIMLISLILIRCYHRIVSRETINPSKSINIITLSIVIGFLSIGCFDHYLWTIQQGQLIFWFSIGILLI